MNILNLIGERGNFTVPLLDSAVVHLWQISLHEHLADLDQHSAILSADERERARKYAFTEHRHRYIVARGLLRQLLSKYVDRPPRTLEFAYNECGKPSLAGGPMFNLAHSCDRVMIVVAATQPIGVDIEAIRPVEGLVSLAGTILTNRELRRFLSLPAVDQLDAFYAYWTCKEATLKAAGCGLSVPLKHVEIRLNSRLGVSTYPAHDSPARIHTWRLVSQTLDQQYMVSVATTQ